jgi:cytidine deaminase
MSHPKLRTRKAGKQVALDDLTPRQQNALNVALAALANAHNFYSSFSVGAALVARNGDVIAGTNFENAAYGSTICAERAAILRANTQGYRDFEGIAVIASADGGPTKEVTGPCGSCRQALWELAGLCERNLYVVLSTTRKDKIIRTSVAELLPLGFGPNNLNGKIAQYLKRWAKARPRPNNAL